MEKQEQQSAENKLRGFATTLNVPFKDFYILLNKAYIDDESIRKRQMEANNQDMQLIQQQLQLIQYRNATMENQLFSYKLERKVWWLKRKQWVRGIFTKHPKP